MVVAWLWLGCAGPSDDDGPVDKGAPDELPLPDIEDVDFQSAFEELFTVGMTVNLDNAWKGHAKTVELGSEGCPDWYAGPPPQAGDNVDEEAGGVAWQDRCKTVGDRRFSGWSWWDGTLERSGDETVGITSEARRQLVGDGLVAYGDTVSFEFDGMANDSIYLLDAGDDTRWVYNSFVDATVTGSLPFDNTTTPGGWRTDLYLSAVGGNAPSITARGNVYLFDTLVQDRFDSVVMDLELVSEAAAGPDDCTLEPLGTLSIRDTNAYWYDLVFLPRYADDSALDEEYSACDGCGTFYVRGQEQPEEVCIDLSFAFDLLEAPDPNDFVLSVRIP